MHPLVRPSSLWMKPLLLALLTVLSVETATWAQSKRDGLPPRPNRPITRLPQAEDEHTLGRRPPVIWVDPQQGRLKGMTVQEVKVDIRVQGHLATTTMEMAFYNPNNRVLEGELIFPLGVGQTVAGYALEVEGKMRQAVVVEKEKGREIFEEVVRRGIDPGLAELTKGNVFRTRVYPIPAQGTKRVSVTFEQELQSQVGEGGTESFRYHLPMAFGEKVGRFHARAEVVKQELSPVTDQQDSAVLSFEKWRDSYVAELTLENARLEKPLSFLVPNGGERNGARSLMVADALEPSIGYFHGRVELEVPEVTPVAKPGRIALFYDASGSAARRDRVLEWRFLDSWLKSLGSVEVDLIAFRNDADAPRRFVIQNGQTAALKEAIDDLPLDGGTSLGAVDLLSVMESDVALLVSDGFFNFDTSNPVRARKDGRPVQLHAVHAAAMVDQVRLQQMAAANGGQVVNLLTTGVEDAVKSLSAVPFQFLGARVISGKVTEVSPSRPEAVGRVFSLAGRVEGRSEVELTFGQGGKVTMTRKITLDPKQALVADRGDFIRRAWAQKRIAELSLEPDSNAATIVALGKAHRLVTEGTSLIVLDRMEDYVRHGIEPPEPELRDEYLALLKKQPKDSRKKDETEHLAAVAKAWKEFTEWHEKRHPWLETVLKPAAEREAALYAALSAESQPGGKTVGQSGKRGALSQEDAAAAAALKEKARDLDSRWKKEGRETASRNQWIEEATKVMLAVDALRQRRLELLPGSDDQLKQEAEGGARDSYGAAGGAVPPPPRPATAAQPMAVMPMSPASPAPAGASRSRASAKSVVGESGDASPPAMTSQIEVKAWDPNTPYLKKLRKAEDAYAAYLKERTANASSSAFFLDCADFFREEKKDERLALRVLSNLAEMELESAPLLRILAYRLQQLERHDLAVPLFEAVLKMRGEEPQSRRDLALCLAERKEPDYARAAWLLSEVVRKQWDGRFRDVELIALHELNDLLKKVPADCPANRRPDVEALGIPAALLEGVPVDLRVVLTWDADNTDMDLWVIDPTGEICIYNHNRTKTGGYMSADCTRGYGPEVFTVRRPLPGTYTVKVNYYGNTQQKLAGATTVQVEFQTAFDQAGKVRRDAVTRRLEDKKEVIEIGKFSVGR
ncbi:VIT domain-containing protein [Verrucomicrobium sp. BvORR106]|uniref:VIT domain-containing protein n=1 Tax=Verrucomicrobium sp. BvORR106 TaxID=1403819 RepID=UPI0009DD51FC|nr:VIT domain-containing protein [Verrucomicrobium sp. BvORR106]